MNGFAKSCDLIIIRNMKKFLKKLSIFSVFFILASCSQNSENPTTMPEMSELPETYNATLDDETRLKLTIERRKEQMQIRKGDYMMSKNNPKAALEFYLPLVAKLPDDVVLYRKIATAYFQLKDWKNSYAYFVRVPLSELTTEEQSNMILALFYLDNEYDRAKELQKFAFTDLQKEYYSTLNACYAGIEKCADILWNYTGTESRILALQTITKDSHKISPEYEYRNLLLAKNFYEQKMYRLAGMFAAEILSNNPNYQEAKKMRAFALYELGKYQESRDLMLDYFSHNPDDMEIIIRLGEVYTFLEDYATANLYFNNAIVAGYKPKTILERRLAYNYAKLGDTAGMTKVLSYLLQEDDAAEDDFAVAISLAIEKNDIARAYSWANTGIRKYRQSKILAPLYIQSLRLARKHTEASIYLSGLSDEMRNLPVVQLEK